MPSWDYEREYNGDDVDFEIVVRFNGYYEPAYTMGLPENCYPEEGDDERVIEELRMFGLDLSGKELTEFLRNNPGLSDAIDKWVEDKEVDPDDD